MGTSKRYTAEVRERAVRLVAEQREQHGSQWAAIQSIAGKIGCTSESLRRWVHEGKRAGLSTSDRERLKRLERENSELMSLTRSRRDSHTEISGIPGAVQSVSPRCTLAARD
jgi:transposase